MVANCKKDRSQYRSHLGFTLLELIVVLVLIGVLAVSLLPRFFDGSGTSEYLYRDQALNLLRRVQMQAMQCTSCPSVGVRVLSDRIFSGANTCTNDATHLCIAERDRSSITLAKTGFNIQLSFDGNGRPVGNCANSGCTVTVQGATNLPICVEAEGYIHPC
jgi:MSHA pilin protein MshC